MERIVKRFLKYVGIDTTAVENANTIPSFEGEWHLARILCEELKQMGLENACVDDHCFVFASIPSNVEKEVPTIGFLAHLDTAAEISGKSVIPQIFWKYDGGELVINGEKNIILNPVQFEELNRYVGEDIITASGDTCLGADDKAGIAVIMEMVQRIQENTNIKHGKISIGFTPDEEISMGGSTIFDVEKFGADFAYTVDGDGVGELNYENFNAAEIKLEFKGKSIHPGEAKDKMINAAMLAAKYVCGLPSLETPEHTSGHEGFYHLLEMNGDVEKTTLLYMIRDFNEEGFKARKEKMLELAKEIREGYGEDACKINIVDEYYNMKDAFKDNMHIVETAKEAYKQCGLEPILIPIRGGTDGATLARKGLLAPNVFMGGHNYHSVHEFVSAQAMNRAADVIVRIVELYAEK